MVINGTDYKLCLLDTCALSDFLLNQNEWILNFDKAFGLGKTIVCYSAFTLSELWYRQELFEKYIELFSFYPSLILEGHQSILDKEVIAYSSNSIVDPVSICPSAINHPTLSKKERLERVISNSDFKSRTLYWKESESSILKSIKSYINNYPPKNSKYSKNEISEFIKLVSTNQLCLREKEFIRNNDIKLIDIMKFPSLITMSYIVFYKFYLDTRKPVDSDIFDIIISSVVPYVDYFITEKNLASIISQIQRRHDYFEDVKVISLVNFKKEMRKHRTIAST